MARVRISFEAEVEDNYVNELARIVDHHLDYLLDLDSFPEITDYSDTELEELD